MAIATGTAIAIGAGVSAAGAIGGAALNAHAAGKAADATQDAAANSLAFNREVYNQTLQNEQPYMNIGNQAAGALGSGLADGSLTAAYPGGAFSYQPFSFTAADFQKDPAYQFNLDQGLQAEQRTAAAQGGLISGAALKGAADYSQGLAANSYQQQFGNALGAYQANYSNALASYQQAYNQFENQQSNTYNRLMGAVQVGQNAASQTAGAGANASNAAANINTGTANSLSNIYTGQAAAATGGIAAATNAITGGINQSVNNNNFIAQQQMMQQGLTGSSYGQTMTPYLPTYPADPRRGGI